MGKENPIPAFYRESKYHSKYIKTGLLAYSGYQRLPNCIEAISDIVMTTLMEITVARQPMIFTWFPIKPLLKGILIEFI